MRHTPYYVILLFMFLGRTLSAQTMHSVLENGVWYKVALTKSGVYKLSAADLLSAGADLSGCNISTVRLMGRENVALPELCSDERPDDLAEMAVTRVDNNSNGIFDADDYLLFYATDNLFWHINDEASSLLTLTCERNPYSDTTFCYLNFGLSPGKTIENVTTPDSIEIANATCVVTDALFHEKELVNVYASGRVWYGETFTDSLSLPLVFEGFVADKPVVMQLDIMGRSSEKFMISAYDDSDTLFSDAVITAHSSGSYGNEIRKTISWTPASPDVNLKIKINASTSATVFLDKVLANYQRRLCYSSAQMCFGVCNETNALSVCNAPDGVLLWDVTNPLEPHNVVCHRSADSIFFVAGNATLNRFVAFEVANAMKPIAIKHIPNQNIHGVTNADMIVLAPSKYYSYAEELAEFHRLNDGLEVFTAKVEDVYNEFSAGNADLTALRDFIRMVYQRSNANLKYVLLFGKASYDVRDILGRGSSFVPTYETALDPCDEINSYCSDDYFGMMDDNDGPECMGLIDIAVGRIPVNSENDAATAIKKIKTYNNIGYTHGMWRGRTLFVADVGNTYLNNSEICSRMLESVSCDAEVGKSFFAAFPVVNVPSGERIPAATADLAKRLDAGALAMFYSGHGGVTGLSKRSVFTTSEIASMNNGVMMPFVYTATCEFSKFDNPELVSAGEQMLLRDNGGAIAMLTTTRPTYATNTVKMSKALAPLLASYDDDGKPYRFGDMVRQAKTHPQFFTYTNRGMVLFGDPALRIALPTQKIIVESQPNESYVPGQVIEIKCRINGNGSIADTSFNGIAEVNFFAGMTKLSTIIEKPKEFSFYNDVVYKGSANVTNGVFSIRFVLPVNVDYDKYVGPRFSLYAYDSIRGVDAFGSWTGFNIDNSQTETNDKEGPDIEMFWNEISFVSGDTVIPKGTLYVKLDDESGVYHYDYLIGRDIILSTTLPQMPELSLNDVLVCQPDEWRGGTAAVPIEEIPFGKHVFTLKAWDMCDNSSTKTIELNVIDNMLYKVSNYPNPFSGTTRFVLSSSLSGDAKVLIEIYNVLGQKVTRLETKADYGASIEWDGTNFAGSKLNAGVYPYSVTIYDGDGTHRSVMQKMIITQ